MIDIGEWLASRAPAPPPELAARLAHVAGGRTCADSVSLSLLLVSEARALLEQLCDDRSAALDLLVADSLITYALEAAAEDCSQFETTASSAIERIAAATNPAGA